MIELRPDQAAPVRELYAALKVHQSVLLHGECGWGKTVVAGFMMDQAHRHGRRAIFAVHRRELARQTAMTLDRFGVPYGYIAAGMQPDPFARVHIASRQTLIRRPGLAKCDLFIPDEAHLWGAATGVALIDEAKASGAKIIPLTATPQRGDGKGLAPIADAMVHGPGAAWLIKNGLLARYRAYAPTAPNLSGLHTQNGDFIVAEVDALLGKPAIIGDRVKSYRAFANGKRMIGYCYSRANGEETAATFQAAGIGAAFIDGETPDNERRRIIQAFADGKLSVLLNCQLFREGFDLSAQVGRDVPIEAVGLYTPTQSLPLAIQMMMRALRRQPGFAILIDHVNIFEMHGFPDDEREWSLAGKIKGKGNTEAAIPSVTCGECFAAFRPRAVCPYCGAPREVEGRVIDEVDGELGELDIEAMRARRRRSVQGARTIEALAEVAFEHGHKAGWIVNTMKARGDRRKDWIPTAAEWREIDAAMTAAAVKTARAAGLKTKDVAKKLLALGTRIDWKEIDRALA